MIEIQLTRGRMALVDDEDAHLAELRWFAEPRANGLCYASRNRPKIGGKSQGLIRLHQAVLDAPKGFEVDHINGNGLDCRRSNLRVVTKSQNQRNRGLFKNSKSGFKGVSWHKISNMWRADIKLEHGQKWLGVFETPEAAARAYDEAASRHFGEFARLNFPKAA